MAKDTLLSRFAGPDNARLPQIAKSNLFNRATSPNVAGLLRNQIASAARRLSDGLASAKATSPQYERSSNSDSGP